MMDARETATLGSTLVVLGIVFGSDWLIGYSLIGAGVSLAIVSAIKARKKKGQVNTSEAGRTHES